MASLSFCGMSPCMEDTVKLASRIFSVSHSTFLFVLQKMTAWVMVRVSYRSHRVSNFHSSFSTATKNCLMPSSVNSSLGTKVTETKVKGHMNGRQKEQRLHERAKVAQKVKGHLKGQRLSERSRQTHRFTRMRIGSVMNFLVISRISCGKVALTNTTCKQSRTSHHGF